jgi:Carboxypeptidase regulatory-like domain
MRRPFFVFAVVAIATSSQGACRRTRGTPAVPDVTTTAVDPRDVRCVERPEGCVFCDGRGAPPPMPDPEEAPSSLCDPKDSANCVDFCSRLAPDCATPWFAGPTCLVGSEEDFRRQIFHLDTADRPEVVLQGRVTDDGGRRIEGAKLRVWFQGTAIAEEVSGKDGGFRIRLRSASIPYAVRISHVGHATEIAEVRLEKPPSTLRSFRLAPESIQKGRVVDGAGAPVPRVDVRALRNIEDAVEASATQTGEDGQFLVSGLENRRYVLVASRFGWLAGSVRVTVTTGPPRVTIRLARTGVIRGRVIDADGDPEANAIVVAMLSGGFGVSISPIIWTTDAMGKFAQDRFGPGTYYLWARHGERLVYPPEKIELAEGHLEVEAELKLSHRGARVRGRIAISSGLPVTGETRAVLVGRSPLAFPRKAVGDVDKAGGFTISGVLPGRYELSIRLGSHVLPIISGPRDVEVPIEEGATVDLPETVVVRPRSEE